MLQVELGLTVDYSIDIITLTFNLPVVSPVSIAWVAECRHFLAPTHWGIKVAVGMQVAPCVHVLESELVTAFQLDACPAFFFIFCSLVCFFNGPQRVVIMIIIKASDSLLTTTRPIAQLTWVQVISRLHILQSHSRWTCEWKLVYCALYVFFWIISSFQQKWWRCQ